MEKKLIFLLGVCSALIGSSVALVTVTSTPSTTSTTTTPSTSTTTPTPPTTFQTPSMNVNHFTATCRNTSMAVLTLKNGYTALPIALCIPVVNTNAHTATLDANCVNNGEFIIQLNPTTGTIIQIKNQTYYSLRCFNDGGTGTYSAQLIWGHTNSAMIERQGFTATPAPHTVKMFALKQSSTPNFDSIATAVPPTATPLNLGEKLQLLFLYTKTSANHTMIIPLYCSAQSGSIRVSLWDIKTCKLENQVLTKFQTVAGTGPKKHDGTWAELTAFQLRQASSADITIECNVRVCGVNATQGFCVEDKYQLDYCKPNNMRRRREAGEHNDVPRKHGAVHHLSTTFTVQDNSFLHETSAAASTSSFMLLTFLVSLLAQRL